MKKIFEVDYDYAENTFKNSDKTWNKNNLKLHKCSEETPNKSGAYIAYEQYDLDDQYLVIWTGEKWIHFESGGDIGFGDKCREDHWSELPDKNPFSEIDLPRYIKTISNVINQLQDVTNTITNYFPTIYYRIDRNEIVSEKTELKFREFVYSLNKDISNWIEKGK